MIKSLNNLVDEFEALKTACSACHSLSSSYLSQNMSLLKPESEIRSLSNFNSYLLKTSEYYARAYDALFRHVVKASGPILIGYGEYLICCVKELSDLLIELQADNFSFYFSLAECFDDLGLKGHFSDVVFDLIQQSKQLSDSLADVENLLSQYVRSL